MASRGKPPRVQFPPPDDDTPNKDVIGFRCPYCDAHDQGAIRTIHAPRRRTVRECECYNCGEKFVVEMKSMPASRERLNEIRMAEAKNSQPNPS